MEKILHLSGSEHVGGRALDSPQADCVWIPVDPNDFDRTRRWRVHANNGAGAGAFSHNRLMKDVGRDAIALASLDELLADGGCVYASRAALQQVRGPSVVLSLGYSTS
jgi:hypothetical protein